MYYPCNQATEGRPLRYVTVDCVTWLHFGESAPYERCYWLTFAKLDFKLVRPRRADLRSRIAI